MGHMRANPNKRAATHFGREMQKERLSHGWSLREMAARTGIDFTTLSRVETGNRTPNEKLARACDLVFPRRSGWFYDYYEESKSWVPAGFRSWAEYEEKAAFLRVWSPGVIDGLLQTEAYALAMLSTVPGVSEEMLAARLANRMERQRRVLGGDRPQLTWFIVDHLSLFRRVGSPEVMVQQCDHLVRVAGLPNVTLQVLPAAGHPANASELIIAGHDAAYVEHLTGGFVHTDEVTISTLLRLFNSIHSESYRASESIAMIRRARGLWTGELPATAAHKAELASKRPAKAGRS
jgi:transcriptional regulator with XRE-family HTH domain